MSKRWMMATATAVLLLAAACGGSDPPEATGGESVSTTAPDGQSASTAAPDVAENGTSATSVDIVDLDFEPAEVEVAVGETITWQNTGDIAHTVTSQSAGFDSGSLDPGDEYTFTPEEPGTISYSCQFHSSMQGTIVVTG